VVVNSRTVGTGESCSGARPITMLIPVIDRTLGPRCANYRMARAKSPEQAGYTNATALTTGAKATLCSLLVGRVHIPLVR